MLLLAAVTPPAVAYSSSGALLRPRSAAAAGHSIARVSGLPNPVREGRKMQAFRSAYPVPSAGSSAIHATQVPTRACVVVTCVP